MMMAMTAMTAILRAEIPVTAVMAVTFGAAWAVPILLLDQFELKGHLPSKLPMAYYRLETSP